MIPTTADPVHVAVARSIVARPLAEESEYQDDMRRLAKAVDEREAEMKRLSVTFRIEELRQQSDDQFDRAAELMDQAMEHPAGSIADVLLKLDIMDEVDADAGRMHEILTADLQRLQIGRA